MTAMEVPHRIVTGCAPWPWPRPSARAACSSPAWPRHAGGDLTRQDGQDRIEFLAQARNSALEVLWLNGSAAGMNVAAEVRAAEDGRPPPAGLGWSGGCHPLLRVINPAPEGTRS